MKVSMVGKFQVAVFALLLCAANLAVAQVATVTHLTGVASATASGSSARERQLKAGDEVNQGETVSTGRNSNAVLTFSDGHLAALSPSSSMVITAYAYDAAKPSASKVLLSLVVGSMRAITGLIGKARPEQVSYRVANVTIGIRGTVVDLATANGSVAVEVIDGVITFSMTTGTGATARTETVTIGKGQGALTENGKLTSGAIATIRALVARNTALNTALKNIQNPDLQKAIENAAAGAGAAGGVPGGAGAGGGGSLSPAQ